MDRPTENSHTLIAQVEKDIDSQKLLSPCDTVVVGVSGGMDSMVLLDILHTLSSRPERNYRLIAAHFDHGLREDSADDAAFVARTSEQMSVECLVRRGDVHADAAKLKQGIEHAARDSRYTFFSEVAETVGASAVAVAHHANDNVETILFRILRGTAVRGLSGIPFCRPLSDETALIRPMLGASRDIIQDYARYRNLQWREDSSNSQMDFSRNFIRGQLLPLIRQRLNVGVDDALLRLGRNAAITEQHLLQEAEKLLEKSVSYQATERILVDTSIFGLASEAVRLAAIRTAMEKLNIPGRSVTADHYHNIDSLPSIGGTINLPGGYAARMEGKQLVIFLRNPKGSF